MKDLFKNYHKHKVLSNLGLLGISAVLAVSVNMFVLSGPTGDSLKANVLEASGVQDEQVDFVAIAQDDSVSFSNTQEMKNVSQISFSLAYNYEIVELDEPSMSGENASIVAIENNDGFSNYIISFSRPQDISANTKIVNIGYNKLSDETVHLNLINVNFTDSENEMYLLSTTGIMF